MAQDTNSAPPPVDKPNAAGTQGSNADISDFWLYDYEVKGPLITVTGTTWSVETSGLATGAHQFTARDLNGVPVSSPWSITVIEGGVIPTIISVKDSSGKEIPDSSLTHNTTVTVSGTAAISEQVQIFDGAALVQTIPTDSAGNWTLLLTGLASKLHVIKAVGQYGNKPESAARIFVVESISGSENFEEVEPFDFKVNTPVIFPSGLTGRLLVSHIIGAYSTCLARQRGYPEMGDRQVYLIDQSIIEFTLPGPCRTVNFSVVSVSGSTSTVKYYNYQNILLATLLIPKNTEFEVNRMAYTSSDQLITHFEVSAADEYIPNLSWGFLVDNIEWSS